MTSSTPPHAAVWLLELFAPTLAWETVRAEPLSTTAQVLASLAVGSLLFREMNGWVGSVRQ